MTTKAERRKHTRYPMKKGAYATISPDSAKLGQIINISMIGLAFKYIDSSNPVMNKQKYPETLFLSSMGYYVGDINFKTISDYEVPDGEIPETFSDTMKIRIRHVKFTDLKLKQLFDLDYYIDNNTTEADNFVSIQ
jgi:hypothetical protein